MDSVSCIQLPDLKKGTAYKQHTKLLQILLTHYGYVLGKCDGIYGTKTEQAVIKFNKDNGIKYTYCTLNTWLILLSM